MLPGRQLTGGDDRCSSVRKATIAFNRDHQHNPSEILISNKLEYCTDPNRSINNNNNNHKLTAYNIDNIVGGNTPKTGKQPPEKNLAQYCVIQHSSENNKNIEECRIYACEANGKLPPEKSLEEYRVYTCDDVKQANANLSAEKNLEEYRVYTCDDVKHANAPTSGDFVHNFSPQMPIPSPNYPAQTHSPTKESSNCHTTLVPLPNTANVPNNNNNVNNSTTTTPQNVTSQSGYNNNNNSYCPLLLHSAGNSIEKKCATKRKRCEYKKKIISNNNTVLNVPSFAINPTLGNDVQTRTIAKRQKIKISKIDLATLRRKLRKQRRKLSNSRTKLADSEPNVNEVRSSDSSESESESESEDDGGMDRRLWIMSGPPCKLEVTPEKVDFLSIFQLTTHGRKNSFELERLEKRKWTLPFEMDHTKTVNENAFSLNLPVPLKSPTILNYLPDYRSKSRFFQVLGLTKVEPHVRQEMEKIWIKIVEERIKRNCQSSLTHYSLKMLNYNKNTVTLTPEDKIETDVSFKIPLVHQVNRHLKIEKKINGEFNNNQYPPSLTMVIVKHPNDVDENRVKIEEIKDELATTFKWPGVSEVVDSYQKFAKERSEDMACLKKRQSTLKEEVGLKQMEVKYLERRQRELRSSWFLKDQESKKLQKIIDQLTCVINTFR